MPQLRKNQPRRSRDQWKSLIDRQCESGLSGKEFCEREALSYASFIKWRSTLRSKSVGKVEDFIELRAEPFPLSMPARDMPTSSKECLLELTVGSSVTVRIYAEQ